MSNGVVNIDRLKVKNLEGFTIQFKSLTAAEWTSANPVLAEGEPGYETDTGKQKIGDGVTTWSSLDYQGVVEIATESAEGIVELATEAEVLAVSDVDAVVRAKHMRVKVETGNGNAVSIGDLGGDARGNGSVTIQASRSEATQVASGTNSVAIGSGATASGYFATASGTNATASGYFATALGYFATALGYFATASGSSATASQANSGAFGCCAKSDTANAQELGYWSNGATRAGAIRVHGTGYVAISTPKTDTAFTEGGATAGSEADGTIFRKGLAFRVSTAGHLIATYCDSAGVITSLDLGAMS